MSKVAITMGDPKGVGPEIVAMVASQFPRDRAAITIFGDPAILEEAAKLHKLPPVSEWGCDVVTVSDTHRGHISQQVVARAVEFCMSEKAALVTAPIAKHRWKMANSVRGELVEPPLCPSTSSGRAVAAHGHTEYLAELTHTRVFGMMMAGPRLRTVPVTIHAPLAQVPELLTIEKIVTQTELTCHFLQKHFNIKNPKMAVTGLNPHAGEQGDLGGEELSIICPAIQALRGQGLDVSGPFPADGVFAKIGSSAHGEHVEPLDAVICMYHDQALIPAKMLDFRNTVNVTMGLPFVRTSPDHGTAEDIAWQGRVDPRHFRAAVEMALTLSS